MNQLTALAVGVGFGVIIQLVAARLRFTDEEWKDIPLGRRAAMAALGGIAAFVVGLWTLDNPRRGETGTYMYRLWEFQAGAAWLGSLFLDAAGQRIIDSLKNFGHRADPGHVPDSGTREPDDEPGADP